MNIIKFFLKDKICLHKNALLKGDEGYCPDCGRYLKKYYYVIRCKHCDIKRIGVFNYDSIIPKTNFCENCGGSEYYVEKLEKINFFDIPYVTFKLEEVEEENRIDNFSEIWVTNVKEGEFGGYINKKVAP